MKSLLQIENSPVYQQVLKDSFGGIMYNVDNRDKYDAEEILSIWEAMSDGERNSADGITKGVMNYLQNW